MTPIEDEAKKIVRELHRKVLATGKFELLENYMSKNFVFHTPYFPHALKGVQGVREFLGSVFASITELKITTNDIIAEGDRVAARWTIEGYSTQEFMNVPAGQDERVICVMTIYHIRNGKIKEAWAVDTSMWPKTFDF